MPPITKELLGVPARILLHNTFEVKTFVHQFIAHVPAGKERVAIYYATATTQVTSLQQPHHNRRCVAHFIMMRLKSHALFALLNFQRLRENKNVKCVARLSLSFAKKNNAR